MAVMPSWFVADELSSGKLVDLLPKWRAPSLDIHVAYFPGRHRTLRLKTFLATIEAQLPEISGIRQAN